MKTRHRNVTLYRDRHGKLRARWRKTGFPTYSFQHLPDTPGFDGELKALLSGQLVEAAPRVIPGSVSDLLARYYRSADFAAKGGDDDKRRRRGLLESFRAEWGNDLVRDFSFEHIEHILLQRAKKREGARGRMVGGQVAATNLRKQLRRLFAYAVKLKWIPSNPVDLAETVGKVKLTGYHTWTEAEIAQYQRKHPLGTKARLALEIILWTGQRRGDTRLFGPKHIVRGKINFKASKNDADLWLPIAGPLKRAIEAMPSVGISTFLVTDYGKPFSKDGFGNKMREWCDQAGLPQCSAHGLRKAIARRMAESAATQAEIKAVGGWKGDQEVATYTAAAAQEGLADSGVARVEQKYGGLENGEP